MSDQQEILNIDYHRRRLILKALNSSASMWEAAELLGISERQLYNWKKDYEICYNRTMDIFFIPQNNELYEPARRKRHKAIA